MGSKDIEVIRITSLINKFGLELRDRVQLGGGVLFILLI